jgi:hypothetical protein
LPEELRYLDHLYVERAGNAEFTRGGQGNPKVRSVEHRAHGLAMRGQLRQALSGSDADRHALSLSVDELQAVGTIIVLEGADVAVALGPSRYRDPT